MNTIERVGVIGGGLMGSGIAEVCARSGCEVVVVESGDAEVERARQRIETSVGRAVRADRLTADAAAGLLGRIRVTTGLAAVASTGLVIEAVAERESLKRVLLTDLAGIVGSETLIASNTSSIPLGKLSAAAGDPTRFLGIHFFNPAPVMPLVEIVPSLSTSAATLTTVTAFVGDTLGKRTIIAPDRAGFVVNALLVPFLLAAARMLEAGLASAADIDAGMVDGCGHPMGPLTLMDLIGLDTIVDVAESLYAETREPLHAPPPGLVRLVDAGHLGRKSGQGFYTYGG